VIPGSEGRRRLAPPFSAALLVALALPLGAAFPAPARAQDTATPPPATVTTGFRPRPVRSGTVSLLGGAMYGTLLGSGRFADEYSSGLGLGFALRYRNSAESSLGFAFESHQFDASVEPDSAAAPKSLQMVMTTVDYYRHYSVRTRTPRYLVVGAGLMQSRQTNLNDETEFPGDGGVIKLGGGFEYWVNRTLTLDVGLRYYGVLSESSLNHDVQAAVALNFYTSP
jgi:hypothetical protein